MRHTQLKIGVQGGHVEHRRETEVKVVQSGRQGGRQLNKKSRWNKNKKQCFFGSRPLTKIVRQPNQEDSDSLPSNHVYLRKGSIRTQEVDLCII
jgi:hypothetical protein